MITLEALSKRYQKGAVKAVDELSLNVKAGEIFGFLGPNGAGKTTTIKMMVGLLVPDEGTVTINGSRMDQDPMAAKQSLSFVPDTPEIYDKLTGLEYLNFLGDVYRVPGPLRRSRIATLLDLFEMRQAVGDLIQSYSRGMRQKIVLTGALLHDPAVFILDEPMVGLDPRSSSHLKDYMRDHCARGNTVFFSTHVLDVAERFCDRIGIIHRGQLIATGTMAALRERAKQRESLESIFLELTGS